MRPKDVVYKITQHYITDQLDVDNQLRNVILGLNRARNYQRLASCTCYFDQALHSIEEWRFLRQIEAFFKKNAEFAEARVCTRAALESFKAAEEMCSDTNRRLKPYINSPHLLDADMSLAYKRMTRYISRVLGDITPFIDQLPDLIRVTPGATSTAKREDSLPQFKMRLKLYATHGAFKYLKSIYHYRGFENLRLRATPANRVEFVPKNWKTDRTIACEPEGNLPLQLAFDTYAKRRLRRFNIDLSDQSRNQRLARLASVNDDFVTVDFKAASDTISFNTVSWLLPPDWLGFLIDVRSPCWGKEGDRSSYAKFSSMGNGATFTLETLIFSAACYASGSKAFSVYGDDVIIEKEYFEAFKALTRFLGFTINEDKTFIDGPFRESCGKDYWKGVDVTPVYIRNMSFQKARLCHLCNSLAVLTYAGSHLENFLLSIIRDNNLPLVPYNESSLSGIWISPERARAPRILFRTQKWPFVDFYKAYVPDTASLSFVDSRGYYLWFLRKRDQVRINEPWHKESLRSSKANEETSVAPVFEHSFSRRRVRWIQTPSKTTPDHLERWAELLIRKRR